MSEQDLINEKFKAIGETINMIAHQWKQPLNVLSLNMANLEIMHMSGKYSKSELEHIIENSTQTIEYMNKTIQDFSHFLTPTIVVDSVKANTIFYQLNTLVMADIKKYKIDFKTTFEFEDSCMIDIRLSKFTQVMINIVKNAIDEIKFRGIENPFIHITMIKDDNFYTIQITDNAGGIDKDIIDNIFQPYVSTKGANGTGLGMYMSKIIIETHLGGSISVSNNQLGAQFLIKLPVQIPH
jgi:nitrogen fixation/metabolism regulation signal transduction histidine kinase